MLQRPPAAAGAPAEPSATGTPKKQLAAGSTAEELLEITEVQYA